MNIQDLIYFNHLATSRNFTATANHFFVSQPSISMSLQRLEKELDTLLLDRKRLHNQMRLTPTGEILHKHAVTVLQILENAQEEINDYKNHMVSFGFLPTVGSYFMPQLLPELGKFASNIKFIEEESSDVMLEMVTSGQVPIAITGGDEPFFNRPSLLQVPLLAQELALWVSPNHPLTKKKQVTPVDLQDVIFISLQKGYTHERVFNQWCEEHYHTPPQIIYTKEIKTALSLAASTDMVAFMIDILVHDKNNLVKITIQNPPIFYISLVVNQASEQTYFQKEFNTLLVDLATQLSDSSLPR
ncbi:HTH-type transcriptional regulator CynR [Jeotgalibaca dankookensis]|uniref:HTH-type transcriptional regulator CynR n=1 Tax=Jeotgalibaca dankookensis TaxID=708126 RepID=A0A1S6IR51_9LACT|nr:LysR family transcriptional regulator [Jeotgalibaca dankookensis]AQS54031.1 HTH-type transcriptional regulator CynR [Jeotgalibaca dankookensis]